MRPHDADADADADAWDDTALVRAYDDAIARHAAPSNAPTARRRGSNEDERANDAPARSGDARREPTPRSSERARARASPVPHYYAETSYGDEYEYEYGRARRRRRRRRDEATTRTTRTVGTTPREMKTMGTLRMSSRRSRRLDAEEDRREDRRREDRRREDRRRPANTVGILIARRRWRREGFARRHRARLRI